MIDLLPKRLIVGLLGCIGCTFLYVLRSNISVAIIAMVEPIQVIHMFNNTGTQTDVCFNTYNISTKSRPTYHGPKYPWNESAQGLVLGAYFYGYTVTQFCGSYADKFGAKWMTGLGVFMPALFNALIPIAAGVHYSLVIVLRALIGAFHGVVYSCLFSMFNKWFPQSEKRWAISGTIFLGNFGGVIAMPLTGYLCESHLLDGWPNVYYLTSLAHILWFVLWHLLVSNTPEEDNNISDAELLYITQNNPQSKSVKNLSIPWREIFTSRPVWGSIVTKMCGQFGYFVLCTKMPTYIDQVFGLSIQSNSWFNSMMYGCLCVTNISAGPLSNWVRNKGWFSNTRNCKNFQSLAMFGSAVSLVLIPIVGCNSGAVIALMLLSMLSYGTVTGGEYGVIPDYALNYSGTIFGVANTLASTPGFIGPLIIGLLLDHGDGSNVRNQWNILWYMSAGIYVLGGLAFELLGSAEPQHWAIVTDNTKPNPSPDISLSIIGNHNSIQ